jgi:hypothetical protein
MMPNKHDKAFHKRLEGLDALGDDSKTIFRVMKKTANPTSRGKQLVQARGIDANRLKLMDEMDELLKSIPT